MIPKTMRSLALGTSLALTLPVSSAQNIDQSEREEMYRRYLEFPSYVERGTIEPQWMADGSSFWYREGATANTPIWKVAPEANSTEPLFDTARLREALKGLVGREPPGQGLPFEDFTFAEGDDRTVRFSVEGSEFVLNMDSYEIRRAAPAEQTEQSEDTNARPAGDTGVPIQTGEIVSPDGQWFASAIDHNLRLRSAADGRMVRLTTDGSSELQWRRPIWSPDSRKLAVAHVDFRGTPGLPLVDFLKPVEEVTWTTRTLDAELGGEPIRVRTIHIFDLESGRSVRVDTGDKPSDRVAVLSWTQDSSELLLLVADRYVLNLTILAVNAETGSTRTLVHDVQDAPRFWFGRFTLLSSGRGFIWLLEDDGWTHAHLYDFERDSNRLLTESSIDVERVIEVDEPRGWVYFLGRGDHRIYDTHLYRVSLDGKNLSRLTEATGHHEVAFAPSKQFFLDTHSTLNRPPRVELRRSDGRLLRTLADADISGLLKLSWKQPEEFVVKAADGTTDMHGVLFKPHDFDPQKKYPLIERLYPIQSIVPRSFVPGRPGKEGPHTWGQAMAQLGFLVMLIDTRGAYADHWYSDGDRHAIPDRVAAIRQLAASRPYIDVGRVGVIGHSNGGYFAIRALLEAPDTYHVGIAVAPVVDRSAHASNIWLGPPEEHKDAHESASLFPLVSKLRGKLLLIHGTHDRLVPLSHTMRMVDALTRAEKPYDLMIVPGWGHWENREWQDYRLETYRRYFVEHLRP